MNRAMLGRMVMRAGTAQLPPGTALMAVAGSLAEASAAVAAGADLIDLGAATAEMIIAFRSRHPGIPVCAAGGPADIVRDAAVAQVTGALLLCADGCRPGQRDAARPSPGRRPARDGARGHRERAGGPGRRGSRRQTGCAARRATASSTFVAAGQAHRESAGSQLASVAGIVGISGGQFLAGRESGADRLPGGGAARAGHGRFGARHPAASPHRPWARLGRYRADGPSVWFANRGSGPALLLF